MTSTDQMMEESINVAKENGFVKEGDTVIIVAGVPLAEVGTTNLLKVSEVK